MKNLIENQKMNRKNIELYNRIIRSLDEILNETLELDYQQPEQMVKVVLLNSNTLGCDDNLDLMTFGNDISLIFNLPGKYTYCYAGPNWNKCNGNELWHRVSNVNKVIGEIDWHYEGVQRIKGYMHPGMVVNTDKQYHYTHVYSGEVPLNTLNILFNDNRYFVKKCSGYSTESVKNFIRMLIDKGLIDE